MFRNGIVRGNINMGGDQVPCLSSSSFSPLFFLSSFSPVHNVIPSLSLSTLCRAVLWWTGEVLHGPTQWTLPCDSAHNCATYWPANPASGRGHNAFEFKKTLHLFFRPSRLRAHEAMELFLKMNVTTVDTKITWIACCSLGFVFSRFGTCQVLGYRALKRDVKARD